MDFTTSIQQVQTFATIVWLFFLVLYTAVLFIQSKVFGAVLPLPKKVVPFAFGVIWLVGGAFEYLVITGVLAVINIIINAILHRPAA